MRVSRLAMAAAPLVSLCICVGTASADKGASVLDAWDFKLKDFVIGAWWGPGGTDAEVKLYREAGFNVVMTGRYMEFDDYAKPDSVMHEMALAEKYGLGVMLDTYTKNDHPWGGKKGETDPHPSHHPASLEELKWLYGRVGHDPALVGFMIGDDQGAVSKRSRECTAFLHDQGPPHLFPWLCGWIAPANLADSNNPIENPQIYPTLYQWGLPADALAQGYAQAYADMSRECQKRGILFWPMFNASHPDNGKQKADMGGWCPSDSLVRFPAYAALAYGAQGIWYFCYGGGSLEHVATPKTDDEARALLTPLYAVAKVANSRIAAWGPRLLGRQSPGLFGTAFGTKASGWPFPEDAGATRSPEALGQPAGGKLIESMSEDLLIGILTRQGENPLAMIVNCRASLGFGDLQPREVSVRFAPAVKNVQVFEGEGGRTLSGPEISLVLDPGGGQLVGLEGDGLAKLCTEESIYAPVPRPAPRTTKGLTADDLRTALAAKLRIDVFGADAAPEYADKWIDLNGEPLVRVPAGNGDRWALKVVDLAPKQMRRLRTTNRITVRTLVPDAWKFRNATLAIQLADGSWVRSTTDANVHSVANWAHSEGETWGPDGTAGPIDLSFPAP